ncbi:stu2 protein [Zygosaccharomyces mellis]|uniref:Stu2 protein n=1 Tax=Zygosaccharomyces mellis TaxID=42258 RepID=A0A4C2DZH0_9SACH|nr:stu2 protein [Zygosaccharomyces mellis]
MSEEDFTRLPLEQKLDHKLWKARLNGYQELSQNFKGGKGQEYWKRPELFGKYLMDSNVVAQEQAVISLETFLKEVDMPGKGIDLKGVFEIWIPALAEKGLSSSRATTKEKASECILVLCSLDQSIVHCTELILPFCEKKMPKLVANSLHSLRDLVGSFGLTNCNAQQLLPQLLAPLGKLAGHADKNVRSETLGLIVEIYKCTGKNRAFLQELLLDQLKPIQQRELDKLFAAADAETFGGQSGRLFVWQRREQENNTKDHDGDTVMEHQFPQDLRNLETDAPVTGAASAPLDPLDLLPEQTILDRLPENFYDRIGSSKWKDRVESLQELYDGVLVPLKKLKHQREDYSHLLGIFGHVIQRDANVQAVSLAAQCIGEICQKMKNANFNKQYVGFVFTPLLERTKEKKTTVVETIRNALQALCRQQYPFASHGHNEDMLQEILNFMKHKTPQIKQETTLLLTFILKELGHQSDSGGGKRILQKYLPDEICPTVTKIVNDTQPTIRECGFECFAVLIKILSRKELHFALEKLDNLKRQKIEEQLDKLPELELTVNAVRTAETPVTKAPTEVAVPTPTPTDDSTIPSKRGPTSPLKKSNSPNVPKSRVLLTSRTLGTPPTNAPLQPAATTTSPTAQVQTQAQAQVNTELAKLQKDKSKWIQERHQLLSQVNKLSNSQTQLISENEALREQLKLSQTDLHERGLQLRSKDLQLTRLQDRIAQLELDLRESHMQVQQHQGSSSEPASAISTNLGVRSISSSSMDPISANGNGHSNRSKHLRTPSESSDDLPRRVDSLQLSASQPGVTNVTGVTGVTGSLPNTVNTTAATTSSSASDAVNEESWKRAAEVTSQLKARIERMRAKTRGIK